jgi:hypothetical protein
MAISLIISFDFRDLIVISNRKINIVSRIQY